MTVTTDISRTHLVSPAVLREHAPDAVEIVVAGRVADHDGRPIDNAVLDLRGVTLHVDAAGSFELLIELAPADARALAISVSAHGFAGTRHLVRTAPQSRLSDGTLIVLQDFALDSLAA